MEVESIQTAMVGAATIVQHESKVGVDTWKAQQIKRCREILLGLGHDYPAGDEVLTSTLRALRKQGLLGGLKGRKNNSIAANLVNDRLARIEENQKTILDKLN